MNRTRAVFVLIVLGALLVVGVGLVSRLISQDGQEGKATPLPKDAVVVEIHSSNTKGVAPRELLLGLGVDLLQALKEAAGNSGHNMHVFAVRKIIQETQQHYGMYPPEEIGIRNQASCRNT